MLLLIAFGAITAQICYYYLWLTPTPRVLVGSGGFWLVLVGSGGGVSQRMSIAFFSSAAVGSPQRRVLWLVLVGSGWSGVFWLVLAAGSANAFPLHFSARQPLAHPNAACSGWFWWVLVGSGVFWLVLAAGSANAFPLHFSARQPFQSPQWHRLGAFRAQICYY
jgi:hypothetical protein